MADSEHNNEFVEAIDTLVISLIEQSKKNKKRSHENAILNYLQKRWNDINRQQTSSLGIASLSKNGIILNKPSSGKNSYTFNPNTTEQFVAKSSPLENPNTPLSSAPKESRVAYKDNDRFKTKEIELLNAGVSALKAFILEQFYVTKKSVKEIHSEIAAPNNLELVENLK